jgi:DNA-binding transcriptional ArsR family regulator
MQVAAPLQHPDVASALADRFRLLSERCVGDIAAELGCSQANVSKHCALLADAGLLDRRRSGLNCYYAVSDPAVFVLCDAAWESLRRHLDARATATARVLTAAELASYMRSRSESTSST